MDTVTCAGCGEELPREEAWMEWLSTPLGWTTQRYHRERSCVVAGREELARFTGGTVKHIDPGPSREERARRKLEAA